MKIDGYARISVDLQEDSSENTSIENQKRIIRDFVAETFPGATLCIYEDRDRSGYTFAQRENYQKMRGELLCGDVSVLIVKDFSRFSRRNSLGLLELETLRDAGVRIISIGDNIDYPTRDDWMLIQFKFLMNEMPVTDTSKKIRQMIDNRQKNGRWICAVPYGYRITDTAKMTYEIDPPAAETVREVFRLYTLGWGYKRIANHLTDSGVPTPRANEIAQKEAEGKASRRTARNEWSIVTVQTILKNDFYIGTLRQRKYTRRGINGRDVKLGGGDNIVIENAHEPIVDSRTFAYAGEQLALRAKSNYRGEKKYAADYSGILFCGDCGSPMFSMSRPDLAPAYTCGTYHRRGRKGCTSHHIRVEVLDRLLKNYLLRVRDNCQTMLGELQKAIDGQPEREEQLGAAVSSVEMQLNDAKARLKALYKEKMRIDAGLSDAKSRTKAALYEEMEEELLTRIEQLEKQFGEVNAMRNTMIAANRKAQTVIGVFDDLLQKERLDKRDIGLIAERITVFEDHLNVKLRSDVDELLSLGNEAHTVNFPSDSRDNVISQSSAKRADKVFTVHVINSGDPLEIFTNPDGEVVFKKYSPIGELAPFAAQYADVLSRAIGQAVLICDRDHVVACAGVSRKDYVDRRVTHAMEELTESRQTHVARAGERERFQPVEGSDRYAAVVAPILASGDVTGSVCLLLPETGAIPGEGDVRLVQVAAAFLGKQMEE